jgi:hypothetical protein
MSTPQDPRARRRQKQRRAKKNETWLAARAQDNQQAMTAKAPAKKAV